MEIRMEKPMKAYMDIRMDGKAYKGLERIYK